MSLIVKLAKEVNGGKMIHLLQILLKLGCSLDSNHNEHNRQINV